MIERFQNDFKMLTKLYCYYPGGGVVVVGMGVVKTRYNAKLSSAKLANWN